MGSSAVSFGLCHLSRLDHAGLSWLGSIASWALAGFGFVKCWVRLARKVRFARRRAAFLMFFGIGELGLPSVLLGDARYGSVTAEFRAFTRSYTPHGPSGASAHALFLRLRFGLIPPIGGGGAFHCPSINKR